MSARFYFHEKVEREKFEDTLKYFIGKIKQTPPVKSSVKRVERQREVHKIDIIEYRKDKKVSKAGLFGRKRYIYKKTFS